MNFEEYLLSKNIDSAAFRTAEPEVWEGWRSEFESLHPASFTAQKLFLINPIRRKYLLKERPVQKITTPTPKETTTTAVPADNSGQSSTTVAAPKKSAVPRPVFKPKPKPD